MGWYEGLRAIFAMVHALTTNPVAIEPKEEVPVMVVIRPVAKPRNSAMTIMEPFKVKTPTPVKTVRRVSRVRVVTVLTPNKEHEDFSKVKMASLYDMGARY